MEAHCKRLNHMAVSNTFRPKIKEHIGDIVNLVQNKIKTWHARWKQRLELLHSNDHYLNELGLTRFDVGKGQRSSYWDVWP